MRKWEPDPCLECLVKVTCTKKLSEGTLCQNKIDYRNFQSLLKYKSRVVFFCFSGVYRRAIFPKEGRAYLIKNDFEFDRKYRKFLIDRFTYDKTKIKPNLDPKFIAKATLDIEGIVGISYTTMKDD